MNVKIVRMAGFFGVAAPLVGFSIIALSIRASPWFSWTGNALSDLGVAGFGSILFNFGLPMTGAVMMMFSVGLFEFTVGCKAGRLGSILHLAGALLLCGVGAFPETAGPIHTYVSIAFFVALPLSLTALTVFMVTHGMRPFAVLTAVAAVAAAGVWLLPWNSAALPEALSALAVGIWQVILGLWMMRRDGSD